MPTDNKSLIQKADLALADLTSGGLLVPEQAKRFIRVLIKRARLLSDVTVEPMSSPKKELNKTRFSGRVLHAGQSAQALQLGQRSKPDLAKVTLDSKLFKAEVRLNDETLEDNIENGNLTNTVMQEFAKAVARDMEDVVIRGDTTSGDLLLAQLDGVIKQTTSNTAAAGGVTLGSDVFRDLLKTLPGEFQVNKGDMKFYTSIKAEIDYRDFLSNRATVTGDRALAADAQSMAQVGWNGIPVIAVPLFPENLGGGTNETVVLFTDPKNIHVGIQRDIRLKTAEDITSGEFIMVMSLRFDVKYAEETAAAKATGVLAA